MMLEGTPGSKSNVLVLGSIQKEITKILDVRKVPGRIHMPSD
jgi:hypothetical protein